MRQPREIKPLPSGLVKSFRQLFTKQGRIAAGRFLVEGVRAVRQLARDHPRAIVEIITIPDTTGTFPGFRTRTADPKQFRSICQTQTPQGLLAVVRLPEEVYTSRPPRRPGNKILLLDGVQDPGNVGTLLRTAAAFGFSGVILSDPCADPYSAKVVQASAGTLLSVWIRKSSRHLEMAETLRKDGYFVITADLQGGPETSMLLNHDRMILALGSEASGASKGLTDLSDYRLLLPILRTRADSLNVASCGAILMYLSTAPAPNRQ